MLQKPLFTLFLSLFHLLPLSDFAHILLCKAVFASLGVAGLYIFIKFVVKLTGMELTNFQKSLLAIILTLASPSILDNFFSIRTDQVCFLIFGLFLIFNLQKKKWLLSLAMIVLLPLIGVKEFVFVLPALFILSARDIDKFKNLKTLYKFYVVAALAASFVWVIGLNIPALSYLAETYKLSDFPNVSLKNFLTSDFLLLISTLGSCFLIFKLEHLAAFRLYAACSLYFLISCFLLPQSYSFYIASLAPFIYLPIFIILFKTTLFSYRQKLSFITLQIMAVMLFRIYNNQNFYNPIYSQLRFIKAVAPILENNNLSYTDGMGVFPRQNFSRCFISPDDTGANSNCLKQIIEKRSDAVIVTGRLFYLGEIVFKSIEIDYEQILPNVWIKKEKINSEIEAKKDLLFSVLPLVIF